jgi:hypothetical protein
LPIQTLLYISFKDILISLISWVSQTLWAHCTLLPS